MFDAVINQRRNLIAIIFDDAKYDFHFFYLIIKISLGVRDICKAVASCKNVL